MVWENPSTRGPRVQNQKRAGCQHSSQGLRFWDLLQVGPLDGRNTGGSWTWPLTQLPALSPPMLLLQASLPPSLISGNPVGHHPHSTLQMPMRIFQCISVRSRELRLSLQMASSLLLQVLNLNVFKMKTRSSNYSFSSCHPATCPSKSVPQKN